MLHKGILRSLHSHLPPRKTIRGHITDAALAKPFLESKKKKNSHINKLWSQNNLTKKCAPHEQHSSPGKKHTMKVKQKNFWHRYSKDCCSLLQTTYHHSAPLAGTAAESAALGFLGWFLSPSLSPMVFRKGLFLAKRVRLLKPIKKHGQTIGTGLRRPDSPSELPFPI